MVLTACGSADADDGGRVATLNSASPAGGTASASSSQSADPSKQLVEFATCMRRNGVDMPDPDVGTDGKIEMRMGARGGAKAAAKAGDVIEKGDANHPKLDPNFEKAQQACKEFMPRVGATLDPEQQAQFQDAMLKFAECMRGEGVDMPDPEFDEGRVMMRGGAAKADEDFEAAEKVCRKHLADFKGPATTETTE